MDKSRLTSVLDYPAYSIAEAARYLGLPYATLRSWVIGRYYPSAGGQRRFQPLIDVADRRRNLLSFRNLVELHVLSAIRREHEVRLQGVRTAIVYLRRAFASRHPLADQQMSTDGTDLFVERYGQLINASRDGQLAMRQMLDAYLRRVERDTKGLAVRLYPMSPREEARVVVIDPKVRFGRPCIADSGIPTALIADRFSAGETIESLAREYGRQPIEIEEAIRFERRAA